MPNKSKKPPSDNSLKKVGRKAAQQVDGVVRKQIGRQSRDDQPRNRGFLLKSFLRKMRNVVQGNNKTRTRRPEKISNYKKDAHELNEQDREKLVAAGYPEKTIKELFPTPDSTPAVSSSGEKSHKR